MISLKSLLVMISLKSLLVMISLKSLLVMISLKSLLVMISLKKFISNDQLSSDRHVGSDYWFILLAPFASNIVNCIWNCFIPIYSSRLTTIFPGICYPFYWLNNWGRGLYNKPPNYKTNINPFVKFVGSEKKKYILLKFFSRTAFLCTLFRKLQIVHIFFFIY